MSLTDIAVDRLHALLARVRHAPTVALLGPPVGRHLVRLLERAVPCYWSWPTVTTVADMTTTFPTDAQMLRSDLIAPVQWWYLDNPALPSLRDDPADIETNLPEAFLIVDGSVIDDPTRLYAVLFNRIKPVNEPPYPIPLPQWTACIPLTAAWSTSRYYSWVADEPLVEEDDVRAYAGTQFVCTGLCWLRSTVAQIDPVRTGRSTRRRLALAADAHIRVITLRHATPSATTDTSRDVSWNCRWAVRSHWRQQAVHDGHRPTLIASYIKGPADKPFRTRDVRYKVDR